MKKIFLIIFLFYTQDFFCQTAIEPAAGDGTIGNPYQIATLENLYWIAANSSRWAFHYLQTADIDASSTSSWSGGGWIPIGNWTNTFTGSYNGDGHTINGLYINRTDSDYQGLFGVTSGATISNLGVTNVDINGALRIGGIAGYTRENCTIEKCFSTGNLSGSHFVGGLVGNNRYSTVNNCYSRGNSTGTYYIGGLVGEIGYSTISNCYSTGSANGSWATGGLVGLSFNTTMNSSYSIGSVIGGAYTGGLVGYNDNTSASSSFWNIESSGQSSSPIGIGKTTVEMKTNSTFLGAGWDPGIWNMGDGINDGYPYLRWQNLSGTPLPVELTSLTALINDGRVTLKWQTETEVNNYGFEIERKSKGIENNWNKLGFVQGHGNSNSPKDYSFTDKDIINGKYVYRLRQIDTDGKFTFSKEIEVDFNNALNDFALNQNYPNPFNPTTKISWQSPVNGWQSIKVYDMLGKEIAILVDGYRSAGNHEIEFDAYQLSSGIYFYQLRTSEFLESKKMILSK